MPAGDAMDNILQQKFKDSVQEANVSGINTQSSQNQLTNLQSQQVDPSESDDPRSAQLKNKSLQSSIDNLQSDINAQNLVNQTFGAMMGDFSNNQSGVAALNQLKDNNEAIRRGVELDPRFENYGDFMQQMYQANPSAMQQVFPFSSGKTASALGGVVSSVLTANPTGIIGSFIKDTLSKKGVIEMDHGGDAGMEAGIAAKVNPAIMISINMGPKLPVNIQEIKEEKKMFKDDKMRASLSGQPNKDQVDLAPYMNTGI